MPLSPCQGCHIETENLEDEVIDLSETFVVQPSLFGGDTLSNLSPSLCDVPKLSLSREHLIQEQKNDPSLATLFSEVMSDGDIERWPHGYLSRDGLLWPLHKMSGKFSIKLWSLSLIVIV